MLYQIIAYLKFLKRSTNEHGVHSPFVFDLVTKCFYNKTRYTEYKKLEKYRNNLISDSSVLNITDLGSGSKYTKSDRRATKAIAQQSGASKKHARLLFRLARYFSFQNSLELGTSLGISTQALALGTSGQITSIEGCPEIFEFTSKNFSANKISNTSLLQGDFANIIPQLNQKSFDFVLFDGNHNKAATLKYFEALLPKVHNDTLFLFDDIYWSQDMTEAWETIKNHPQVKVTIDTFQYGFVFFRKEQAKEHFTIRL